MTPGKVTIVDQFGRPLELRKARSSYDAAADTASNRRHWENADALSAKAANSPAIRKKLRECARLEYDNGGNCRGAIETIAHDRMGTCPRLQVTGVSTSDAREIEKAFARWASDPVVNLTDKLRVSNESELRDGEYFFRFRMNPGIEDACKLDLEGIETEVCCTPDASNWNDRNLVDGIEFDRFGNPAFYHLLRQHPGDQAWAAATEYDRVHTSEIIHWFRPSRAGQRRGIPRITPGLPLHAQLRGYASATLAAARMAAHYAAVLKTNMPPDGEARGDIAMWDDFYLEEGTGLTLPAGWDLTQLKSEHPTTNYPAFREAKLAEFGRPIHAPRVVVTGDASQHNFSSARLEYCLFYQGAIRIDRGRAKVQKLNRIARMWAEHATAIPGYLPATLPPVSQWSIDWRFDGFSSIDPVKDATANEIMLRTGEKSYAEILAERGVYWEDHFEQIGRERKCAKELGIEDLLWPDQTAAAADRQTRLATEPEPQRRPADEEDTVLEDEEVAYA